MRILVTGGGGFIGSHLVHRVLREGHDVAVLDNFSSGRRENLAGVTGDVEVVEGDVRSYERVHAAIRRCDVVLHQAALPSVPRSVQDPLTSTEVNVTGTLNVLLNARDAGVERVVFASSSSVYGSADTLPKHEGMAPAPMSPYAVSKLAGEGFCRSFGEIYGLRSIALRYFNVFGPRQDPSSEYAAVVPRFLAACSSGIPPTIYGDGTQSRDFTYVENVVEANLAAMAAPEQAAGGAYNVACGERITLNALLETMRELTQSTVEAEHAPPRPGDVPHSQADVSLAARALGWTPTVGLREGLRRTLETLPQIAAGARP